MFQCQQLELDHKSQGSACPGCRQLRRLTEGPIPRPAVATEAAAGRSGGGTPGGGALRQPARVRRRARVCAAAFRRPVVTLATAPSAKRGARARRQDGERRRDGDGGAGRARCFPPPQSGEPRRGPALTRLRSPLCPDALPGQAGRGGYPAAGRQAEEEREEGAAAGRAPGPEGLHRRDRLAGGNGRRRG